MRRAHRAVTLKYFSSSLRVRLFSSSSSESSSSSTSGKFADVCVAIGSNLDVREGEDADSSSRFQHFHVALRLLQERGFEIKKLASVYETKPVDTLIENQPEISKLGVRVEAPERVVGFRMSRENERHRTRNGQRRIQHG